MTRDRFPRMLLILQSCWTFAFLGTVHAQEAPQRPEELKALENFSGTWDTEGHINQAKWTPEEKQMKGRIRCQWILEGQVMQGNASFSDQDGLERDALILWSYNKHKKTYRTWQFISDGNLVEFSGQWDAESRSLVFTDHRDDGIVDTMVIQFKDSETIVVNREAKGADGMVYLSLGVRWTRTR